LTQSTTGGRQTVASTRQNNLYAWPSDANNPASWLHSTSNSCCPLTFTEREFIYATNRQWKLNKTNAVYTVKLKRQ